MKSDNAVNGAASAATSPNSPANPGTQSSSNHAAPEQADFLRQQAQQAEAAIGAVAADITHRLREAASPVEWAREYPLLSVGVAAVAGFIGAAALIPSREQQAMARLAALERALHPKPQGATDEKANHDHANPQTISSMLLHEVVALIRPTALSLISGLIGAAAGKTNGQAEQAAVPEPQADVNADR